MDNLSARLCCPSDRLSIRLPVLVFSAAVCVPVPVHPSPRRRFVRSYVRSFVRSFARGLAGTKHKARCDSIREITRRQSWRQSLPNTVLSSRGYLRNDSIFRHDVIASSHQVQKSNSPLPVCCQEPLSFEAGEAELRFGTGLSFSE